MSQEIMAQQLVAATDRQQHQAIINRRADRWPLPLHEVGGYQGLPAVLPAAEERDVDRPPIDLAANADRQQVERDAAPGAPLGQRQNITAIAVDIHLVRVKMRQLQSIAHSYSDRVRKPDSLERSRTCYCTMACMVR